MAGFRVLLVACLVALFQVTSAATSHTVGDSGGWARPSTSTLYSTWAAKQVFQVGDSLVFNFATGSHTVEEVSKLVYESCATTAPPISSTEIGPATITISTAGTHYYVCTMTGHCKDGQKLAITTAATSNTTATAPSPTGTSNTTATAPSPTSTSDSPPSPPPPSGSATVAGVGLVLPFLLVAAAFLF